MTTENFTIYRGQAKSIDLNVSPVVNIAGWSIRFTAARARGSVAKVIGPLAASVVDANAGAYRVSLTASMTDVRPAEYEFDVWRTDAGLEEPLAFGTLTIAGAVRLP